VTHARPTEDCVLQQGVAAYNLLWDVCRLGRRPTTAENSAEARPPLTPPNLKPVVHQHPTKMHYADVTYSLW